LTPANFISGTELKREELISLFDRAEQLKRNRRTHEQPLRGKSVALLFESPSTRTRVSFHVGVSELGGEALVLRGDELQIRRGESLRDTALVLSRYVDAIVARLADHPSIEAFAEYSEVPVVNALTPLHHPCQALADLLTLRERFGSLDGLRLAYVGDGNNVCNSLMLLASGVGVEVVVATPPDLAPDPAIVREAPGRVVIGTDPRAAATGAHALYTDVWVSMGDEQEAGKDIRQRRALLTPYQLNEDLLALARADAIVLHCLPAHPGEEITEGLLYGERSAVWDQAENRLHAQKALLERLLATMEMREPGAPG
jgi:ornithine carbamoyltransferase